MRFFKTDDPARIAENEAAAERLMAITSRTKAGRSPDLAEQSSPEVPVTGQASETLQ